ncbi:hypothetical protein [Flavobacterium taihuense]|uniref:Uncharacterized protein n=1 Tax=Flavobacterium taihuense TaxID=2857508 RepID=A0ABS6XZ51_9FLAO|nr:hypothetical protein [Flavobacterium taihuense]MBW4361947.1 hypothetical protein [Flavobacterium taihuense]
MKKLVITLDQTISGNGSYGCSFLKDYKASVNLGLNWAKYNNIQNRVLASSESFTQSYILKVATNYKDLPNLEVGYNGEYKVSGTNILNTTSLNDDSFSQFLTKVSRYTVQPRYIVFWLKYDKETEVCAAF